MRVKLNVFTYTLVAVLCGIFALAGDACQTVDDNDIANSSKCVVTACFSTLLCGAAAYSTVSVFITRLMAVNENPRQLLASFVCCWPPTPN